MICFQVSHLYTKEDRDHELIDHTIIVPNT